jgi:hypothetical protein
MTISARPRLSLMRMGTGSPKASQPPPADETSKKMTLYSKPPIRRGENYLILHYVKIMLSLIMNIIVN